MNSDQIESTAITIEKTRMHSSIVASESNVSLSKMLSDAVRLEPIKEPSSASSSPSSNTFKSQTMDFSAHSLSNNKKSILKRTSSYIGDSIGKSSPSIESSTGRSAKGGSVGVKFQAVKIREYNRTIGDNPSCLAGVPISLDWSHSHESNFNLDVYEKLKGMKRSTSMMRIPSKTRESMLKMNLGYSDEEISQAKKEINKIKRSRSLNDFTSPFWRVEEVAKSGIRKLKRSLGGNKSKPQTDHEAAVESAILEAKNPRTCDCSEYSIGSSFGSDSNGPIDF